MPTDDCVRALEQASADRQPAAYRYYSSTLRLQLSISARHLGTLVEHTDHIELSPWQLKTSLVGHGKAKLYTATKHARTATNWWHPVPPSSSQIPQH